MSIIRIGSTKNYADNWERALGSKKTAKKKTAKKPAAQSKKKATSRKK